MKKLLMLIGVMALLPLLGCSPSKDSLKQMFEENPEIIFNAIEKNPKEFIDTVNKAAGSARKRAQEDAAKEEEERIEDEFKNPKKAEIESDRVIFGKKDAPITIVEYSDFECPYCSRGYTTVKKVMEEYGDKVRIVYKHLPLDFHPMAEPAAKYFEAIGLQSHSKAEKFHDMIFENQGDLKSGKEKYLEDAAKKVGVDMAKLKKDLNSDKVMERIKTDMAEARKFGISGTPGFLINGVTLKGAYPFEEFKKIIDRHLEK